MAENNWNSETGKSIWTCCKEFRESSRVGREWSAKDREVYILNTVYGCATCGPDNVADGPPIKFCPWCGTPAYVARGENVNA